MRPEQLSFAAFAAVLLSTSLSAPAATVNWGSATNISGDTDVATNGMFVEAFALGSSTTTVNGATFTGVTSGFGGNTVAIGANDTLTASGSFSSFTASSASAPFSNLSSAYQGLLGSWAVDTSTTSMNLNLGGLTVGQIYQLQLWVNLSWTPVTAPPFQDTATAGNSVILREQTNDAAGGTGQFAIGTFMADGTTETIGISNSQLPIINGYELRNVTAVPEPTTALFGVAMMGACAVSRRRRS
jgi:hypothetical protein